MVLTQQLLVGAVYISTVLIATPVYLRILYLFVSKPMYRNIQCYQIMTQMGLSQCLMATGYFTFGLAQLLDKDNFGIASIFTRTCFAGTTTEAFLGFVLVLNRLVIMCSVPIPSVAFKVLQFLGALLYVTYIAIYSTPLATIIITPGFYIMRMNITPTSKTWLIVSGSILQSMLFTTFVLYAILIAHIIYTRYSKGALTNLKKK